ncbi:MAG: fatty acid desaturase, partial [Flavobacteriales bacterium]|nr:fatty acid desaturase [Flavobacteriales bacterium]
MWILLFVVVLWYSGLFFQSFFLHRYAAHQSFQMSRFGEKLCFVLTWLTQGSNYLSPYAYGVMHRMHHAYADTENDPHSPTYDPTMFAMMWRTKNLFTDILLRRITVDEKFTRNVPRWDRFDLMASHWTTRLAWGAVYVLVFAILATAWWQWLFLPVVWLMAPIHGAIINWFAHKYGYTNFSVSDTSKNLLRFDWLMMGEGYHNNHHKHSGRPNFGSVRWYE